MNEDTIKLLKECNSGCKMATNSMEQVQPYLKNERLKSIIDRYNDHHIRLGDECHQLLNQLDEDEKDPSRLQKVFSSVSTEVKLIINDDNHKIAELMIDGCHMGIKSLSEYINKYKLASIESLDIARRLVKLEQDFMNELLEYL
jgi:thiamine monophosphate synthase